MTKETDEQLMAEARRGSRDSLNVLVRRYGGQLLTYVTRMVGDSHLGEELFQEVFLAVWRKRHTYKVGKPFRSWLYAIATNRCRQHFRRATGTTVAPIESDWEPAAADPSPLETALHTELGSFIEQAVTSLPAQQRSVVVLRIWSGMSYAEIAHSLGCREATARSHMHHGLATLRGTLEPQLRRQQ